MVETTTSRHHGILILPGHRSCSQRRGCDTGTCSARDAYWRDEVAEHRGMDILLISTRNGTKGSRLYEIGQANSVLSKRSGRYQGGCFRRGRFLARGDWKPRSEADAGHTNILPRSRSQQITYRSSREAWTSVRAAPKSRQLLLQLTESCTTPAAAAMHFSRCGNGQAGVADGHQRRLILSTHGTRDKSRSPRAALALTFHGPGRGAVADRQQVSARIGTSAKYGVLYWPGDEGTAAPRIVVATSDSKYLIQLDAKTGALYKKFGKDGVLDLRINAMEKLSYSDYTVSMSPHLSTRISPSSPPATGGARLYGPPGRSAVHFDLEQAGERSVARTTLYRIPGMRISRVGVRMTGRIRRETRQLGSDDGGLPSSGIHFYGDWQRD